MTPCALRTPEQRAAVERLGPARIGLEEDVAVGKVSEVEIDAGLAADVAQAACRLDQLRVGEREIAPGGHVESDQPRLARRIDGKLVAERAHHALNAGPEAASERVADVDIEHAAPWSAHAGPSALLAILIAGLDGDQGMARMARGDHGKLGRGREAPEHEDIESGVDGLRRSALLDHALDAGR